MIGCCTFVFPSRTVQAAEATLPSEIEEALRQNSERLSPISVSWSQQFTSRFPHQETMTRLEHHMPAELFFFKASHRVVWQDGKIYTSERTPTEEDGVLTDFVQERSLDGKVCYAGYRYKNGPILFKDPLDRMIQDQPCTAFYDVAYFEAAGFRMPREISEWAEPRAMCEVLYLLGRDGDLRSVGSAVVGGRDLMRIELLADNPVKRDAEHQDPQELKEYLDFSPDPPEVKRKVVERVEEQRRLPAKQRFVYYLDPGLHYALRRWEHWYEPDTLLLRCDASQFEELPGRQLWLPRRCEIQYYSFSTTIPGTFFEEAFLSKLLQVTRVGLDRVPEDQFVLEYSAPGCRIRDGTLPEAEQTSDGYVRYVVPARLENLDQAIEEARMRITDPEHALFRRGSPLVRALIVLNLLLLVCVAAYLAWRSRQRRRDAGKETP
jgi:hypothetical protein